MALSWNEIRGKMSSIYLSVFGFTDEAGNEITMGKNPGGRFLKVRHASGTNIEINDKGEIAIKAVGSQSEITMDGARNILVEKDLTITSRKGSIKLRAESGTVDIDAQKTVSMMSRGADVKLKADKGNLSMEGQNWSTSIKTFSSHWNGGDYKRTVGGNMTVIASSGKSKSNYVLNDSAFLTAKDSMFIGNNVYVQGRKGLGIGSGGDAALVSVNKLTVKSEDKDIDITAATTMDIFSGTNMRLESDEGSVTTYGPTGTRLQDVDSPVGVPVKIV